MKEDLDDSIRRVIEGMDRWEERNDREKEEVWSSEGRWRVKKLECCGVG